MGMYTRVLRDDPQIVDSWPSDDVARAVDWHDGDRIVIKTATSAREYVLVANCTLTTDWYNVGPSISMNATSNIDPVDPNTWYTTGKWVSTSMDKVLEGTVSFGAIPAGQTAIMTGTITGASLTIPSMVSITNPGILQSLVYVTSRDVIATNTVQISIRNASATEQAAGTLTVKVVQL